MTGYGKARCTLLGNTYALEIKTLNSKTIEINFKASATVREQELALRKLITQELVRGKIDIFLSEEKLELPKLINYPLLQQTYNELTLFAKQQNISSDNLLPSILQLNDISKTNSIDFNEEDTEQLTKAMVLAIEEVVKFRTLEGKTLETDIQHRIALIEVYNEQLSEYESLRINKIKQKFISELTQLSELSINQERLEQELIYYIERLDITEERVRLKNHTKYFVEVMATSAVEKGKKLGFIAQEIGREINTIGSKANDVNIQHLVVQLKDELEKIKEQLNNVL